MYAFTVSDSLRREVLARELLDSLHDSLAIGIGVRLDRDATIHGIQRSLPPLYGLDR